MDYCRVYDEGHEDNKAVISHCICTDNAMDALRKISTDAMYCMDLLFVLRRLRLHGSSHRIMIVCDCISCIAYRRREVRRGGSLPFLGEARTGQRDDLVRRSPLLLSEAAAVAFPLSLNGSIIKTDACQNITYVLQNCVCYCACGNAELLTGDIFFQSTPRDGKTNRASIRCY